MEHYNLALAGILVGNEARRAVYRLLPEERAEKVPSILKPGPDSFSRRADAAAEHAGLEELMKYSQEHEVDMQLVVDPGKGMLYPVRDTGAEERIFVYMDAVDGTIKVAGLGNDEEHKKYRVCNDGVWATGVAFTDKTSKGVDELMIRDFEVSVIKDGNPAKHASYPKEAIAVGAEDEKIWESRESVISPHDTMGSRIRTTTNTNMGQGVVFFDAFQAYDRKSSPIENERLAPELYKRLINRNDGGAFDLWRIYGSLGALQRTMFGWRYEHAWYEPQGVGFLVLNENLPNMIPSVPVVEGAGGLAMDFDGNPLRDRMLVDGRTNIIYAANGSIAEQLLDHVKAARKNM